VEGAEGEIFFFPCNKWLDTNEDDGKIERVLQLDNLNDDMGQDSELNGIYNKTL
jgi:hypothetical protein